MDQNQKNIEIKKENKKALPKMLLFFAGCFLLGGLIGVGTAFLHDVGMEAVKAALDGFFRSAALFVIPAASVLLMLPATILSIGQKKAVAALDPEDEAAYKKIDGTLSIALTLSSVYMIAVYFGLAIWLAYALAMSGGEMIGMLVEIVIALIWFTVHQQKTVDMVKRMNPEKKGSVYDLKFQKVWMDSCDEREQMIIYKSAYAAYKTMSTALIVLFLAVAIGAIPFGYGPLPAALVLVIWLVQLLSYLKEAARLEKE